MKIIVIYFDALNLIPLLYLACQHPTRSLANQVSLSETDQNSLKIVISNRVKVKLFYTFVEGLDTDICERWMNSVVCELLPGNFHSMFTLALRTSNLGENNT